MNLTYSQNQYCQATHFNVIDLEIEYGIIVQLDILHGVFSGNSSLYDGSCVHFGLPKNSLMSPNSVDSIISISVDVYFLPEFPMSNTTVKRVGTSCNSLTAAAHVFISHVLTVIISHPITFSCQTTNDEESRAKKAVATVSDFPVLVVLLTDC